MYIYPSDRNPPPTPVDATIFDVSYEFLYSDVDIP